MKAIIALLVMLAAAWAAPELPSELTVDEQTYYGVSYSSHDAATVSIVHSNGLARIPLAKLPENFRAAFGYDAAAAQQAEATRAALAGQYQQSVRQRSEDIKAQKHAMRADREFREFVRKEGQIVRVSVFQVLPNGVLAHELQIDEAGLAEDLALMRAGRIEPTRNQVAELEDAGAIPTRRTVFLSGFVGKPAEGDKIKVLAVPGEHYRYPDVDGVERTVKSWRAGATYKWGTLDAIKDGAEEDAASR